MQDLTRSRGRGDDPTGTRDASVTRRHRHQPPSLITPPTSRPLRSERKGLKYLARNASLVEEARHALGLRRDEQGPAAVGHLVSTGSPPCRARRPPGRRQAARQPLPLRASTDTESWPAWRSPRLLNGETGVG